MWWQASSHRWQSIWLRTWYAHESTTHHWFNTTSAQKTQTQKKFQKIQTAYYHPTSKQNIVLSTTCTLTVRNTYLLFICGRYEWIDERVWIWLDNYYSWHISKVSLWQFVTLGGELPAMTMTEAIVRLIPGVINPNESNRWKL